MPTNQKESKEIKISQSDLKKFDENFYCINSRSKGGEHSIEFLNRLAQTVTGSNLKNLFVIATTNDGKMKSLLIDPEDNWDFSTNKYANVSDSSSYDAEILTNPNTLTLKINTTSGRICIQQADGSYKCFPP